MLGWGPGLHQMLGQGLKLDQELRQILGLETDIGTKETEVETGTRTV